MNTFIITFNNIMIIILLKIFCYTNFQFKKIERAESITQNIINNNVIIQYIL